MSRDLSHSLGYVRHCLLEHNMAHLVQCTGGGGCYSTIKQDFWIKFMN